MKNNLYLEERMKRWTNTMREILDIKNNINKKESSNNDNNNNWNILN